MLNPDEDGRIALLNAQGEVLFGYAPAEMLGQMVEMLVPESVRSVRLRHRQAYDVEPHLRPREKM